MPGRNFLFVPGPTNVPERILRAMHRAMEDHRSAAFPELATGLFRDLRTVFKTTTGQAFLFPATGTGGWEAALVNTLSPGDRVSGARARRPTASERSCRRTSSTRSRESWSSTTKRRRA